MHDIRRVREVPEEVKKSIGRKNFPADVDHLLEMDNRWRDLTRSSDDLRAEMNKASKAIGVAKKAGRDAEKEMEASRQLKEKGAQIEEEKRDLRQKMDELLMSWPAEPADDAPEGFTAADNVVYKEAGSLPGYDFSPADHLTLAKNLRLLDMDRGAKVTGSGWPLYTGLGASLERALINFMLDTHSRENGYRELFVPMVVNRDSARGTGQLPKLENDMYHIDQEDFFLIPTSEVPITNMHRDEILDLEELPLRYTAFSSCFRREAGAYGAETRGLLRVHQFNKVELVQIVKPSESAEVHQQILAQATSILDRLNIPYRVIELCAGDMSFAAAKCYDIEVWSPANETWLEASSVSNFRDFQARRMNLRYRPEGGGKPEHPHTLNGSGLATSRLMVSLLECNQTKDGEIVIPEALRPYLGGMERITGDHR